MPRGAPPGLACRRAARNRSGRWRAGRFEPNRKAAAGAAAGVLQAAAGEARAVYSAGTAGRFCRAAHARVCAGGLANGSSALFSAAARIGSGRRGLRFKARRAVVACGRGVRGRRLRRLSPKVTNRSFEESGFEESSPRDFGAGETAPEEWLDNAEPDVDADGLAGEAGAGDSAGSRRIFPSLTKPRPEGQRPFAPQPPRDDAAPRRLWIVGFVVGMLVLLVAVVAFQLRDRPEDLRQKAAAPVIAPEAGANGKIVDRIGVGSDGARATPSAGNAPAQDDAAAKSAAPAEETASSGGRAALLIQAPEEASKVRTFLGSVVWKVDNVSNGPGDPLSMAVRAEIDIPEEKLQTVVTLQKNFDGGLPASHTMKIQFNEAADSPLGAIQQINVPQMRRENTATGDGLSGVPVAITDNSFLVGLTRGNAEANNLDLLTSREWIDVPMVLSDGKIAKLTFEKGSTGDRAIADALAAWKAQ